MPENKHGYELDYWQKLLSSGVLWFVFAILILIVLGLNLVRLGKVSGEQVGILLNKINGKVEIIPESGMKVYNGLTSKFFVLDKTIQTLEMTEDLNRGERVEKDDLKIKTIDGSDVYVDLKVQYRIIPEMADVVIKTSGPGDMFKTVWARDYVRSICRNYLGALTTEEFYDSSKRKAKVNLAHKAINERLKDFGIKITDIVVPRKPHFYKEYEEMIKKKKLADQAVLEERSKAQAAKQKQQTMIVQETNLKNVAVEQFKGLMEQKIIEAEAEGEKARKASDAYFDKLTIGAEAGLYQKKKKATGILAKKEAEAKGIEAMKKAMEGEGGRNMVKLEYAKKLKNIKFSGQPYSVESKVEKFEHNQAATHTGQKK